jgi:hypothetical protein
MHLWWGGGGRNRCIMLIMTLLKLWGWVNLNRCIMLSKGSAFIICTSKVLSPAQAPMGFGLMISYLRDSCFNQLIQRLVKFLIATRIGDIVEKKVKVPPRFKLGSLDSESKVLTITPRNLLAESAFQPQCVMHDPVLSCISPSQHNTTVWTPHNSMGSGFASFSFT